MERLPYIDDHSIQIGVARENVWRALAPALRADLGGAVAPALSRLLALEPARRTGDWRGEAQLGATLAGFAVAETDAPRRLELRGRHRFSSYALIFELDDTRGDSCTLRARTFAEFPGLTGRAYRALVIGSRGHRLVVKRLLRSIARRT
ncbi:MAG: hypothetical protein ACYDHN_00710 [Solirubrobacteraceae bacterium]